jgi:cold-inducible RNA-binding protein
MTTLMKLVATIFAAAVLFAGPASASPSQVKLFVGNLSYTTNESDLRTQFSEYGFVQNVTLIRDKQTGFSKGTAFVTMRSPEDAQDAIAALHGKELHGRNLTVRFAESRVERGAGSSGNPRERGR